MTPFHSRDVCTLCVSCVISLTLHGICCVLDCLQPPSVVAALPGSKRENISALILSFYALMLKA